MDRRQRKTRNAIFAAFTQLLSKKEFSAITVQEIIDKADIGRATFYAHFETKDYLLKSICEELFSHLFGEDTVSAYSSCTQSGDVFLHMLNHIKHNDSQLLAMLTSPNNELFLGYFKSALQNSLEPRLIITENSVPADFLINHITSTVVETVFWWAKRGLRDTPEAVAGYITAVLGETGIKK